MRIRLSRPRSILLAAVAVLLPLDIGYLVAKTRPEPVEASIYLWPELVVGQPEAKERPSLAADGSWIDGGRAVDIGKFEEPQEQRMDGGPASVIRISLGADSSYGHFLKSLHALARARRCSFAISVEGPARAAGGDVFVQSVVEVLDPETGIVTGCMPSTASRLG